GLALVPPPPNDHFTNRWPLAGSSLATNGTTIGSTIESGEPDAFGITGVWFSWVAPLTGEANVSAAFTNAAPYVTIYTGSTLATLSQVAGGSNHVAFPVTNGVTYQIAVRDSRQEA